MVNFFPSWLPPKYCKLFDGLERPVISSTKEGIVWKGPLLFFWIRKKPFTLKEIKRVLFSFDGCKVPISDYDLIYRSVERPAKLIIV